MDKGCEGWKFFWICIFHLIVTLPPGARSSYVAYYIRDQDLANSVLRTHLLMISMAGLSYLR